MVPSAEEKPSSRKNRSRTPADCRLISAAFPILLIFAEFSSGRLERGGFRAILSLAGQR